MDKFGGNAVPRNLFSRSESGTRSGCGRARLMVRLFEKRDRFELVTTANASPEIRCPTWFFLEPDRRGDQAAALRTRIMVGEIIRSGSKHDASPICFGGCKLLAGATRQKSTLFLSHPRPHNKLTARRTRSLRGQKAAARRRTLYQFLSRHTVGNALSVSREIGTQNSMVLIWRISSYEPESILGSSPRTCFARKLSREPAGSLQFSLALP